MNNEKYYNDYCDFVERLELNIDNLKKQKRMVEDMIQYESGRLNVAKVTRDTLSKIVMEK